jgi:hypothetical protein
MKLSNPVNPLTIPALVTWLNAILKTMPIGSAMNNAMRTQLGRIQIYGSINRYFFFIDILCFCTRLKGPCCGDRPDKHPACLLTVHLMKSRRVAAA